MNFRSPQIDNFSLQGQYIDGHHQQKIINEIRLIEYHRWR